MIHLFKIYQVDVNAHINFKGYLTKCLLINIYYNYCYKCTHMFT
jgi:hypothetical protein